MSKDLNWETLSAKSICKTRIFDVTAVRRKSSENQESEFTVLTSPDWVNVIPYYEDQNGNPFFIMERQFRHGSGCVTTEFPGGIIENGEQSRDAALRELEEETSIKCKKLTFLGKINPNSAFLSNTGYFYLAEGLTFDGSLHLDPDEQIEVIKVPCSEFFEKMGSGEFSNGVMAIAGFFYNRYRNMH